MTEYKIQKGFEYSNTRHLETPYRKNSYWQKKKGNRKMVAFQKNYNNALFRTLISES